MRVQVGVILSLKDDTEIPVFQEIDDQKYLEAQKRLEKDIFEIMRDYVFEKFKAEDEKEFQKYMKLVKR